MKKRTHQGTGEGRQGDAQAHALPEAEREKTTLSYGVLCMFLTQATKVVNERPVTQEGYTINKSEKDDTDMSLDKHAIKRTTSEEIHNFRKTQFWDPNINVRITRRNFFMF